MEGIGEGGKIKGGDGARERQIAWVTRLGQGQNELREVKRAVKVLQSKRVAEALARACPMRAEL